VTDAEWAQAKTVLDELQTKIAALTDEAAQCEVDRDRYAREANGLEARLAALTAELENQWEYNHVEHCGHLPCVNPNGCQWPRPAALDAARGTPP
jgi:hypothetical protein